MQVINCKIKTFGIYQFISLAPVNIFDSSNSWEVCVLLKLVKVFLVTERCWRCDKLACTEKSTLLASSEITVTPLPPLCFRSFYIMSQFISDLIDGVTWISQRILHCDLFGKRVGGTLRGKIFHSWSGNEEVSFHPVFQVYPACWRLCPSLAHTTGTLGAMKGPQCAEKGRWEGTWALSIWMWGEGWVFSLFPGSFCLRHSPLMRVNEDKLVWV